VRAESARRVALANSRGQQVFEADPDGAWAKLVDVYTEHIRDNHPKG
jgi:hypothetical protein